MRAKLAALLCVFALAASARAAGTGDEYVEYTGIANARNKQTFLYGERQIVVYNGGRLTGRTILYTCADGTLFARKKVSYREAESPDFNFDDASNGMREGVRSEGAVRTMFFKPNRTDAEKSAPLPNAPGMVVDTGFDAFIRSHWRELMTDSPLPLRFLVPSRLQVMNFEVQHLRSDHFDGRPTEVFRMKLSGIVGLIFSGIEVSYDADEHLLMRYQGLSDLRDASGNNLQVDIVFHAKDRKPSSAQTLAEAQAAPLAPCH